MTLSETDWKPPTISRPLIQNDKHKRDLSYDKIRHVQVFRTIFTKYHLNIALHATWLGFFESNHIFHVKKSWNSNRPENKMQT